MQEKLNRDIASCSPRAKSTFPYLHRAVSKNESEKYINCSDHHKQMARTLQAIVTKTKFDTSDEALVAFAYEYYRLASLAKLNESNSQRMLMILSFYLKLKQQVKKFTSLFLGYVQLVYTSSTK